MTRRSYFYPSHLLPDRLPPGACAFMPGFRAPFASPVASPGVIPAAVPWYLAGGVSPSNCIAAYQPKGAASLAASYSNLANPGTYDAAPGTAPSFNAATGWTFAAASSQYLDSGVTPGTNQSWSLIVRFSDVTTSGGNTLAAIYDRQENNLGLTAYWFGSQCYFWNMAETNYAAGTATGGVNAVAGRECYENGTNVVTLASATGTPDRTVLIGACRDVPTANIFRFLDGKIQALAIYDTVLSSTQVAAITAAMAAL